MDEEIEGRVGEQCPKCNEFRWITPSGDPKAEWHSCSCGNIVWYKAVRS